MASTRGSALRPSWRWVAHAALVVLMLLTQQVAWRHGLSHWPASNGQPSTATGTPSASTLEQADSPCLQCLAYAAMADTLQQAQAPGVPCLLGDVCAPAAAHTPHEASAQLAYRSRAPPVV
jgi:hypothetical protein